METDGDVVSPMGVLFFKVVNKMMRSFVGSAVCHFLSNLHPFEHNIYLARHGESRSAKKGMRDLVSLNQWLGGQPMPTRVPPMMLEEVMIQQRVVMIEEVMIRTLCCNLCKHSENQRGGWGGRQPPP